MFQWLIQIEIPGQRELGSNVIKTITAFEAFGPEHATEGDAKAWIRRANLEEPGPYRLASPPVRTRTVVVLEGLDDGPQGIPPATADDTFTARRERRRCPHCEKVVTAKAEVAGETVTHDGSTWHRACFAELSPATQAAIVEQVPAEVANAPAEPISMVAAGVGEAKHAELQALFNGKRLSDCTSRELLAAVNADDVPEDTRNAISAELGARSDDGRQIDGQPIAEHKTKCVMCKEEKPTAAPWRHVADMGPVCAACNDKAGVPLQPSPASDLAAAVSPPRSSTEPFVDVRGEVLEVFDGKAWYWQKYQRADTAEKTARKAMELIATAGNLGGVTVMMKAGRAPVQAGA